MAEGRGMPHKTGSHSTVGDTFEISIGISENVVIGNDSTLVVYNGSKSYKKKKRISAKYPITDSIEPITTSEKLDLKGKIGKHWRDLGIRLGFESAELEQIEIDYKNDVSERVYQILTKWQQRETDGATKAALAQIFMKMKRGDLADILAAKT